MMILCGAVDLWVKTLRVTASDHASRGLPGCPGIVWVGGFDAVF